MQAYASSSLLRLRAEAAAKEAAEAAGGVASSGRGWLEDDKAPSTRHVLAVTGLTLTLPFP